MTALSMTAFSGLYKIRDGNSLPLHSCTPSMKQRTCGFSFNVRSLPNLLGSVQPKNKVFARNAVQPDEGPTWMKHFRREHGEHMLPLKTEMHGSKVRPGRPPPAGPYNNILLQAFNWESHSKYPWYEELAGKVDDIAAAGITDVWLPPPSQSVDKQGYLPSQLYNLNDSKYGTLEELENLIDLLHGHGICSIADIVINHRSGWRQDGGGHWNVFEGGTKDKRLDWGPWAVVDNDAFDSGGKGHHDTGESYGAAPDLDHTNKQVQDELTDWLNWLKAEVGFDGWRFDFVKGYAPEYTKLYCERTNPTFAVGELWTSMEYEDGHVAYNQNAHRQVLCDWIDATNGLVSAFDFTTKGILQDAVCGALWRLRDRDGRPSGLIGWYPQRAVTFIDNHDTGSTQRHWVFPDDKVLLGYAYIITHPGTPCIFYDHLFDPKLSEPIKKLIEIRKRNDINAASKVTIQAAEADIYVAQVDEQLIVKIGSRFEMGVILPDPLKWKLATSGENFAVWENVKPLPSPVLDVSELIQEPPEAVVDPIQSSHHLRLSEKMSCNTIKKIVENVPQLLNGEESENQILKKCNLKIPEPLAKAAEGAVDD